MPNPDKVFRLKYLNTDEPKKYMLTVIQSMPFAVGKHSFLVDNLTYKPEEKSFVGQLSDGTVVTQFPDTYPYMLVNISQYEPVSYEEAKREMKEMAKAEEEEPEEVVTEQSRRGYV